MSVILINSIRGSPPEVSMPPVMPAARAGGSAQRVPARKMHRHWSDHCMIDPGFEMPKPAMMGSGQAVSAGGRQVEGRNTPKESSCLFEEQ